MQGRLGGHRAVGAFERTALSAEATARFPPGSDLEAHFAAPTKVNRLPERAREGECFFTNESLLVAETLRSNTEPPYMKSLTLLLALSLSCHAVASASTLPVALGGAPESSLVAAFLGAVTVAAGLIRIRRRRR